MNNNIIQLETATETLAFVDAFYASIDHKPLLLQFDKECEINGEKVAFDYCSTTELEKAIAFYDNAEYIGSGLRTWYNGVLNEWDELHHFFKKKAV